MGPNWELACRCQYCGGRLTLSIFHSFARQYLINLDGHPRKRGRKSSEGDMDLCTVWCYDCGALWDGKNAVLDNDGVWIRGEGLSP